MGILRNFDFKRKMYHKKYTIDKILLEHMDGLVINLNLTANTYEVLNFKKIINQKIPIKGNIDEDIIELIKDRVHPLDQGSLYGLVSEQITKQYTNDDKNALHKTVRIYNEISSRYETYSITIHILTHRQNTIKESLLFIENQFETSNPIDTKKIIMNSIHSAKEISGYQVYIINLTKDFIEPIDRKQPYVSSVHVREKYSEKFIEYVRDYIYAEDRKEYLDKFCYQNLMKAYEGKIYEIVNEERHLKKNGAYEWFITIVTVISEPLEGDVVCVAAVKSIENIIESYLQKYQCDEMNIQHRSGIEEKVKKIPYVKGAHYTREKGVRYYKNKTVSHCYCIYQYIYSTNTFFVLQADKKIGNKKRVYNAGEDFEKYIKQFVHKDDFMNVKSSIEKMTASEYNQKEMYVEYRRCMSKGIYQWACMLGRLRQDNKDSQDRRLYIYIKNIQSNVNTKQSNAIVRNVFATTMNAFRVTYGEIKVATQTYKIVNAFGDDRGMEYGTYSQLMGRLARMVVEEDREWFCETIEFETILSKVKKERVELEYRFNINDGELRWYGLNFTYYKSDNKEEYLYLFIYDSTNTKARMEASINEQLMIQQMHFDELIDMSGDRLRVVTEQTNVIIFDWDLMKDTFYISPNWTHNFGFVFQDKNIISFLMNQNYIFPKDSYLIKEFQNNIGKSTDDVIICRIKDISDNYVKYKISTHCKRNDEDKVIKIVGTMEKYVVF